MGGDVVVVGACQRDALLGVDQRTFEGGETLLSLETNRIVATLPTLNERR